MSLYIPDPVAVQPEVHLSSWQVFLADRGTMHFVGKDLAAEGRVSSRIVSFDRQSMVGKTRSGRTYSLIGAPGEHLDGMYVWGHWKRINGVNEARTVSLDELEKFLTSNASAKP